ncbi:MAG: phosphoribosylaminoimidazolesuccinocarboxamide synthase [Bacteroidia bacterium]
MQIPVKETRFHFANQTGRMHGKVRDIYFIGDDFLLMIATDRISAFDIILPEAIPYKGEILNQIAAANLKATQDIVPNWLLEVPDPAVSFGHRCEPFPVEMVIRGYLCGHAWREYNSGKRIICGVKMPEGMRQNDPFPEPIITPTIKAKEGHDEDISSQEIIAQKLVSAEDYAFLEKYTRALFKRGTKLAKKRGLVLADTKYEFGKRKNIIYLIDEVHTPDSSRYFYSEGFDKRQKAGEPQKQLSKEFVREWLMESGFSGKENQQMPEMTDEIVLMIQNRYVELYEKLMGGKFEFSDRSRVEHRLAENILATITRYY